MHHKYMMHSCQLLNTNVPNSYCYCPIQSCEARNGQRFEETSYLSPRFNSEAGQIDLVQEVFVNTVCRHHPEADNHQCSLCHEYQTYDGKLTADSVGKGPHPPELPVKPAVAPEKNFFGKVSDVRGILQAYTRAFLIQYFYQVKSPQAMNSNNSDAVDDFVPNSADMASPTGYECFAGGEYQRAGDDDGGGLAEIFRKIWHGFIVMGTRREFCEIGTE